MPGADPAVPLLEWAAAERFGASVAVTTRAGGVSAAPYDTLNLGLHVGDRPADVVANRARAAAAFGVPFDAVVFAQQVHGTTVTPVGPADAGRGTRTAEDALAATDALVTVSPAVTLAILVADCVPVALVDAAAGVLAAVHAGWRGTAGGVLARTLAAMAERGATPAATVAYLGPAVAPDRYQVGDEVHDALAGAVAPAALADGVARPDGPGHWLVDLIAANRQQLVQAGVPAANVFDSATTTAGPELFSDRAERPCGRFALLARLLG
jgi:YfiH family protein